MFLDALYRNEGGTFMTEEYVEAGRLLQDLVRREYLPKGFNGMDYDTGQSRSLVYSGKAAMILMGTWFLGAANNEAPQVVDKVDIFRFPEIQDGEGDPTNLIGSPGQDYFAIASASKAPEKAKVFLRDYLMNEEYVEYMSTEVGYVPPVKNASQYVTEPVMKKVARYFEQAGHVQVYYDQFLPPALGELHKDLVQSLFGLDISPREVARRHEEAMKEEMGE
jgi:raffinose/stachyose/melibiose transport system substrate-binding protein